MKMNREQLQIVQMALADQDRRIRKNGPKAYYATGATREQILAWERAREQMLEFMAEITVPAPAA